jgi:hypothetical protein
MSRQYLLKKYSNLASLLLIEPVVYNKLVKKVTNLICSAQTLEDNNQLWCESLEESFALYLDKYFQIVDMGDKLPQELINLDILSEVKTDCRSQYQNPLYKPIYEDVKFQIMQDVLLQAYPIPNRNCKYFLLYHNRQYLMESFMKLCLLHSTMTEVNLDEITSLEKFVNEKNRLKSIYVDDGGRPELYDLVAIYNITKK